MSRCALQRLARQSPPLPSSLPRSSTRWLPPRHHIVFVVPSDRHPSLSRRPTAPDPARSSATLWTGAILLGIAISGALLLPGAITDPTPSRLVMAPNTPPGRPSTLTPEQDKKLRELWAITMRVFGVDVTSDSIASDVPATLAQAAANEAAVTDSRKGKKKSRINVFKRNKDGKDAETDSSTTPTASTPTDISRLSLSTDDDKHGQNAGFRAALADIAPEELRQVFWSMVKHDHPDALLLRFLRARKWDVDQALVMLISTMHWRRAELHVDDDIIKNGELGALENTSGDAKWQKNNQDFLAQLRMGKSFLHGLDGQGRPMCFVRARLHKQGEQTEESLERFTVYTIETARMLLRPPIDTATIVFDMTDFSMANMDYTPVKFMIKCFEANYPESLGTVLVYKAPWVFNAIWSIIRGWLDPVVAGKVHFAKNIDELSVHVPKSQIPMDFGGDEKWEYKYLEPVPGENDRMKDTEAKQALEQERASIVNQYESSILNWVRAGDAATESVEARRRERDEAAERLRQNYWKLDPYVRARSLYDRQGVLLDDGQLDFYGQAKAAATPALTETGADDLD